MVMAPTLCCIFKSFEVLRIWQGRDPRLTRERNLCTQCLWLAEHVYEKQDAQYLEIEIADPYGISQPAKLPATKKLRTSEMDADCYRMPIDAIGCYRMLIYADGPIGC